MLERIEYSVTFPSTGRTLAEKITFKTGFGTITGPNESGKSFVIEMVRWALFGSKALRGSAADMKKARAVLDFSVRGEHYRVERVSTNAKLFKGDSEIAVGTSSVNEKIVQTLGFGLAVFDASCVANQGEIESLALMKPTERKRLVDSVIGLGVIDDLSSAAGEEAKSLNRLAFDLSEAAREPEPPTKPEGYRSMSSIDKDIESLSDAKDQLNQLRGWLSHVKKEPVPPEDPDLPDVAFLEELVTDLEVLRATVNKYKMDLNTLPVASQFSDEELDEMEAQTSRYNLWQKEKAQVERADQLKKQIDHLKSHGNHTCPACDHQWAVEEDAILKLEAQLNEIVLPEKLEPVAKPELADFEIENHRNRNFYNTEREALVKQIKQLEQQLSDSPNWPKMLKDRIAYDEAHSRFMKELTDYQAWTQEVDQKKAQMALLEVKVGGLDSLQKLRNEVVIYDTMKGRYDQDLKAYTETLQNVSGLQEEARQWGKAKEALIALRGLVKQHLMPSLNKVSSHYLYQMTGGQRQTIHADEDFNITVDGQPLNTLSGSGKAVACLSLRLGLGQVLTNNVFSLFVGDEIDASMDKDRAENTSLTLQTLKNRISQILLVTHKFPPADYYITVGNTYEPEEFVS